ncbi:3-methylcrotonyl-CoA carboxylase subunit alpha [Lineolata rhizophorae]|uniref:3-methylcrotonyl-CoA carboxylase subunit alpha n=1 Tax=Lineolata rhizophorae TaxID=578093 RepID=A0A6A6NRC3_9PEZI|nr:3-methylcrotonyl-CoA carboxylase subunit alpha [Lineolata rhizophorae]
MSSVRLPRGLARLPAHGRPARHGIRSQSSQAVASPTKPLSSVLIANRGEIALRVARTASAYGIRTTTLYTDPDARSQHALSSPFAVNLGDPTAYLDGEKIIQVARLRGCVGIHPGYGFLSENADFARKCTEAGLTFIGPPWTAIEAMGSKSRSKEIMTAAGVPCIPGYHGSNQDPAFLEREAKKIGYPVLLKAVKGGGGKGMRIAHSVDEFAAQLASAKTEARNSFGDDTMLVERYITTPRHIEVQVFADKHGNCVALGERDCSIQRRHQKILEESPAPHLPDEVRKDLWEKAKAAALAVGYEGAGTVEFIFDNDTGEFFFMEMNTRLQVEHPVTEMVTGEDLVRWQLLVAEGQKLPLTQEEIEKQISERGWAIEARIYAENPDMNFIPDSGTLLHLRTPPTSGTVRIDAGFVAGDEVSSHYDPMIAKLIVRAPSRSAALQKLRAALEAYEVAGPVTNIEFLKKLCTSPAFVAGDVETGYISKHATELFTREPVPPEAFAQAALGLLIVESRGKGAAANAFGPAGSQMGFGAPTGFRSRAISLAEVAPDGGAASGAASGSHAGSTITGSAAAEAAEVRVTQTGPNKFDITVGNGEASYAGVVAEWDAARRRLTSYFPHARIETTLVRDGDGDGVTAFQHGRQFRLRVAAPRWAKEALGAAELKNSVLAPMPCKVLRVDVREGDAVRKDQPLVVIESMKMETVIRSPHDGVIKKVVHRAGDICKAGTALVEFEEEASSP